MHSFCCLSGLRLFATLWTVAWQAPLFMEFSRQDYYSGVAIPFSSGSSLTQRWNPGLLHCRQILYGLSHQGRSNAGGADSVPGGETKIPYSFQWAHPPPQKKSHPPFPFFQPQLWASLVVQTINNLPAIQETRIRSLGQGRSVGEGNDYPLQYSCLEKSMDRGTWWGTVHGVAKSLTWLSD